MLLLIVTAIGWANLNFREQAMMAISATASKIDYLWNKTTGYAHNETRRPSLNYKYGDFGTNNRLVGMTDKTAYQPGETIHIYSRAKGGGPIDYSFIHVESGERRRTGSIDSVGWIGPLFYHSAEGFDLESFQKAEINSSELKTGWHNLKLNANGVKQSIPILIETTVGRRALFVYGTDTLHAYVSSGDLPTFYRRKRGDEYFARPKVFPMSISIDFRKDGCSQNVIQRDRHLETMLSTIGLDVDIVGDKYLDNANDLADYDLIVLGSHNEYWTPGKFDALKNFHRDGGAMLFLGANSAWRYVLPFDGYEVFDGGGALFGEHRWTQQLLGSRYDRVGYNTHAGFSLVESDHFLTQGLPEQFGNESFLSECSLGSSGHETDKKIDDAFITLATGDQQGGADIVFKPRTEKYGPVLNFGSIALFHGAKDPAIQSLVKRYIDYAFTPKKTDSTSPD
ncbi:hypothetical protein OAS86_02435 [Gammaproteobacteria bacterium]|nr:hypothetical protein [Gammaproteobacteria bacterium]